MGAGDTTNVMMGERGDPAVFFGPSVARSIDLNPRTDTGAELLSDGSVAGAVTAGEAASPLAGITLKTFTRSPAGMLLVLLPFAYIAWHKVFGGG